jgi:autotransporter-associated beta strand protein
MKITIPVLRRLQFAVFLAGLLAGQSLFAAPITNVWRAAGTDGFWTNSANWTNLSGVANVPATNDVLVFTGSTQLNSTNNYTNAAANLIFSGIIFDANAGAFNLWGGAITPGGGFTNNSTIGQTINLPIVVSGGPANTSRPFSVLQASGNLILNGVVSGATNIAKTGPGTLTLNATNTFTGALSVAGPLVISPSGELNSGAYAGAITNTGTITFNGGNAQTLSGPITNGTAGIINLNGAAAETLSGTSVNNGTIAIGSGIPTISGTLTNNGTLTFNTPNAATLSATLIGAGPLNQNGTGTLTVSASSTAFTGLTTVNAGELINNTGSASGGSVVVASGATNSVQVTTSGGQATLGGLTYNSGTAWLVVGFSQTPSGVFAPLQVNGNLAINGTLNIIVATNGSVALSAGAFPLIKYTGTLSGTPPTTAFALPTGLTATIVNNTANKSIDLDITAGGNQVSWAVGSGTWDFSTANWTFRSPSQPNFSAPAADYSDGEFVVFEDVLSGASPITVTLNTTVNPTNVLFNNNTKSYAIVGTGSISGATGLTKEGSNSLDFTTVQNYSGATTLDAGTTILDFTSGVPALLNSLSPLVVAAGNMNVIGSTTQQSSQDFAGTTFNSGASTITVNGSQQPAVNLGAITENLGGTVVFYGLATDTGATGSSTPVAATGVITTTTAGGFTGGLVYGTSSQSGYATVGAYDWAVTSGSSPYLIEGASQTGSFYTVVNGGSFAANQNADIQGNVSCAASTTSGITLRFNSPGSSTVNIRSVTDGAGILVTPNVGANNIIFNGTSFWCAQRNGANRAPVFWQNNTNGLLVFQTQIQDSGTAGDGQVQAGPGTVVYTGANTYTSQTWLNGGVAEIFADNGVGNPANGANLNLNGGTVMGGTSFTLDNAGANKRPIVIGYAGGGIAASSNKFFTVDGVISGPTGTGPLFIGIPASSANGNVIGLLPGTGPNTANPATNATGTVLLTGANIYTGGTIIYSGTLNFTPGALGTGPVTLNGGTLQLPASSSIDFSTTQGLIVGPNGGILDLNGNNLTFASTITGNGAIVVTNGTLTLTAANTYSGGTTIGSGATLIINNTSGSATGSGPVTVQNSATLTGTGSFAGNLIVNRGGNFNPGQTSGTGSLSIGTLTVGPAGTFTAPGANISVNFGASANNQIIVANSGGLTLSGGAINLNIAGTLFPYTTVGTYNLIQYTGAIGGTGLDSTWTTVNANNPHVANPQVGFDYAYGTSGGYLTVTISVDPTAINATWITDANGSWSTPANWNSNPNIPNVAGSAATFGIETAERTVTLDANETVGVINFTNSLSFIIANGGNTLTLDKNGYGANINVQAGTANAIQTAIALNDGAEFILGSNKSVTVSGTIANASTTPEVVSATGAGTLALTSANTYGPATSGSFGTVLGTGATLQVGNNAALGAGDVEYVANSTLQAGAAGLTVPNNIDVVSSVSGTVDTAGNNLTLGGVISDNGSLVKVGAGTLTLNGANTYAGGTTVKGGSINITADTNLGATTPLLLNGGGLEGTGTVSIGLTRNLAIGPAGGAIGTNGLLDAASGSTLTVPSSINGAGNLGLNGLIVNGLAGPTAGTVALEGPGTFTGTTVISNGILLLLGNANGSTVTDNESLSGSTFSATGAGSLLFDPTVATATFGGLSGNEPVALTNSIGSPITLTVGGNNISNRFSGSLYDAGTGGKLTKVGTSTLTLTGSNGFTGLTTVNTGTLEIASNGVLNVGTLAGQGYLVTGGLLTNASTTVSSLGQVNNAFSQTAGTVSVGELTEANNDGILIQVTGGNFSSTWVALARANDYATAPTVAAPIVANTTTGFYVNSTNTSQPAQVDLGQLTIAGANGANSSASARMDAGSMTVTNEIQIGNHGSTGRWSVFEINGGRFTNLDTVNGIVISQDTASVNDSELFFAGGSNFVQLISFGTPSGTTGGNGVMIITNSSVFVGTGGIVLGNPTGSYNPSIWLENGGLLGALSDWSSSIVPTATANSGWTLQSGGTFTFLAADANGVAHNITINGGINGTASVVKSGGGTLTLSGTNSWAGSTTINAGKLALNDSPNSALLTSTNLTLAGGTLDYSATTNDFLVSGQTLQGTGSVLGSLIAAPGSKIYAGLPGAYGTNTFANLTLQGSVPAFLALGLVHAGSTSNGLFNVTGNLTLNGNPIHITAPSTTNGLDTNGDYILFNVTGTITGAAASAPVWDVRPTNAANFNIVTLAHSIVLRSYSSSTLPPTGIAAVAPPNLYQGQSAVVTATVTNGSSSLASVVLNESAIGGSSSVAMTFTTSPSSGVSNYTASISIPTSFSPSTLALTVVVTDNSGNTAVLPVVFSVYPGRLWTGLGADNNWSTGLNWLGGVAPNPAGDTVTFAGTTRLTPIMDQTFVLSGLSFDTTAGAFSLTNASATLLELYGGITNSSTQTETVGIQISMLSPVTFAANAGPLVIPGTIDNGTYLLTVAGTNNTTLTGGVADTGGLTFTGTNVLSLPSINTYSGPTVVSAGTLTVGTNGQLGGGSYGAAIGLTTTNSVLNYFGINNQSLTGVISGAGALNVIGVVMPTPGNTNAVVTLGAGSSFTGNIVISNAYVSDTQGENSTAPTVGGLGNPQTSGRTVTVNKNGVLSLDAGGGNEFGGGASAPAFGFVINQGGILQITSGNATIGPLTLNGGTVIVNDDSGTAGAAGAEYEPIELGSTVTVGGTSASLLTNSFNTVNAGMNLGVNTTSGQTTFTVAATGSASPDLTVAVPLFDAGGNVVGTSTRGLIKAGTGRMSMTVQSYYRGVTAINGGILNLGTTETPGTGGPLGNTTAANTITFGGGALQYSAVNQYDYSSRFSTAAGQLFSIDTAGQTITFASPLISTTGTLTKLGAGTLTLNGANAYGGTTTVSNGTLALAAGASLSNSSSIAISAGATFNVSALASYTLGSSASLIASGTGASQATLAGNGTVSLGSRPITLTYSGAPALNVSSGTLTLNGNAFTINGAVLPVSGTPVVLIQSSSAITASGTFTATGTAIGIGTTGTITVVGNQVLLTVGNQTPPTLTFVQTGVTSLQFTWPAAYLGYGLQSNSINVASNNDWFTITGSTTNTNVTIPIRSTNPAVFFRLQAP